MNKYNKSTDATGSQKWNIFQYVYVVELLLKSPEDATIYVETYWDVSDWKITTELKHKINKTSLWDKHEDLWKTIYNRLSGYDEYILYDSLVFYTTAHLPNTSTLIDWNNKNSEEKFNVLNDIIKFWVADWIKKYVDYFNEFDQQKIKYCLDKIIISTDNDNLEKKVLEIVKNKFIFWTLKNKNNWKQLFLDMMWVFIGFYILKNDISREEFMEVLRPKMLQYREFEHILSPYSFKNTSELSKYRSEKFIKELQEIWIPDCSQEKDIRDYSYANNDLFELSKNTSLINEVCKYRDELLDNLWTLKDEHLFSESSRNLYFDSKKLPLIKNPYFENNRYFQNWNIHINVNDNNFTWLYKKNGETSTDLQINT